ncbi:hypothetical protein F4604DRAFT_1685731 [Suillus subluteus]|nr:hypothetical protein F4604DRAFT_1685731 [Suillus subluteus]
MHMCNHPPATAKYIVVIHTEPMHGTVPTEYEHLFREMRAPIPQKIGSFITQARNFVLVFQIEDSFQQDDPAGPSFHQYLFSHFETAGLAFSGSSSPSSSTSQRTPAPQLPWSFLMTGKGQRSTRGAKLLPLRLSPEHVTHREIQRNGTRLPAPSAPYHDHTLVFIRPIDGHGMHCCLAPRLWNGHFESALHEELEEIQCSAMCITESVPDADVAAAIQTGQLSLLEVLTTSGISSTTTTLASTSESQSPRPSAPVSPSSPSASASSASSANSVSALSSSSSLFASASPSGSSASILPTSASSSSLFASASLPASASFSASPSASVSVPASTTPRSSRVALHEWHSRLERDLELLRGAAGQGDHVIHITAPDAMQAAESFLALCKVWYQSSGQLVFPDDIEIINGTPLNLIIGSIDAAIGYGVRDGPMRSVWAALITMITQYSGHWQLMSEGYYMPIVTSLPPCDEDIISFSAYSLIIRTGLILGMELLPIAISSQYLCQ